MKVNSTAAALTFIALAIMWQSQNNKYAIERLDAERFIKLNTRTGVIEDYCHIRDPISCMKWDLSRKQSDEEMDRYAEESYKRLRKEAGLD